MRAAFTLDDLPLWPHSAYPDGYTAEGICDALVRALDESGIDGVYACSNSAPLVKNPKLANVLDRWVAAGHHIANHTHTVACRSALGTKEKPRTKRGKSCATGPCRGQ